MGRACSGPDFMATYNLMFLVAGSSARTYKHVQVEYSAGQREDRLHHGLDW